MNPSMRLKGSEAQIWRFMMKRKRLKCIINSGKKTILKDIFAGSEKKSREEMCMKKLELWFLIYSSFCFGRS